VIRTELNQQDYTGIHNTIRLAFAREDEANLVHSIRGNNAIFILELSMVAEVNSTIIGHAMLSKVTIVNESNEYDALALAPVSVHPDYQKMGVGTQMIHKLLDTAKELGHTIVIVAGHASYYPRFGFVPARAKGIEAPFPIADDCFLVLELKENALDGITGTVKYSKEFGIPEQ
jgi:putative acetyltransferase